MNGHPGMNGVNAQSLVDKEIDIRQGNANKRQKMEEICAKGYQKSFKLALLGHALVSLLFVTQFFKNSVHLKFLSFFQFNQSSEIVFKRMISTSSMPM